MSMFRAVVLALCSLLATQASLAAEFRMPLQAQQVLVLDLPEGWSCQLRAADAQGATTAAISASDAKAFQLLVTPLPARGGNKPPSSDELRALVHAAADKARPRATEAELALHELGAAARHGYYFSATDAHPEPGGWRHMSQGALGLGPLTVTFTVLIAGEPAARLAQSLELIRSMRLGAAGAAR